MLFIYLCKTPNKQTNKLSLLNGHHVQHYMCRCSLKDQLIWRSTDTDYFAKVVYQIIVITEYFVSSNVFKLRTNQDVFLSVRFITFLTFPSNFFELSHSFMIHHYWCKQAQESLAAAMSLSGIITSWADCYKTPNIALQTSNFDKISLHTVCRTIRTY